jgi:DNA repair protein RadC
MIITDQFGKVSTSKSVYEIVNALLYQRQETERHKEYFYAFGLNSMNEILYVDVVSIGTVNYVTPFTREILRLALIKNAVGIIVAHNHPSGSIQPSNEDRRYTMELNQACGMMNIKLLDHIVAGDGFYSFSDEGGL